MLRGSFFVLLLSGLVFTASAFAAPTPTQVADINPGSAGSLPRVLTNVGGTLLFAARDDAAGVELWRSDGTGVGTALVKDINPGSAGSFPGSVDSSANPQVAKVGSTFFFSANDGTHGYELWKSNGTESGTTLVDDINPGISSSFPQLMINVGGRLFLSAYDNARGQELWTSNGTAAGTEPATRGSSNLRLHERRTLLPTESRRFSS